MATQAKNQNEGTILLMVTFPWPWPCPTRITIAQRGPATIFAEPNGSLSVQISSENQIFEFQSCPLVFDGQTSTNVGASWNLPDVINMIVGQTIVLSTENPAIVPTEARVASGVSNDVRDFTEENTEAFLKRRDTLAGSKADKKLKPTRREATSNEIFDALQKAQQQIVDLLTSVEQGKVYHVDGLLRLLRHTITDKQDKPLPLLQLCAAMISSPLIVFAPPISTFKEPLQMAGLETLAFPISPSPTDFLKNAVDLDFWLESRAVQLEGRVLNQRELINNVANSVAAHFDIYVRPEADMLRNWKSGIAGVDSDFVVHYTVAISAAVKDVIIPILAGRPT